MNQTLCPIVLLSLAMLVGCAAPGYAPPSEGPTAKLTFVIRASDPVGVWLFKDVATCSGEMNLGKLPPYNPTTVSVAAGHPVAFRFSYVELKPNFPHCIQTVIFTPEPGKEYLAAFHLVKNIGVCVSQVFPQPPESTEKVPQRVISNKLGAKSSEPCKQL